MILVHVLRVHVVIPFWLANNISEKPKHREDVEGGGELGDTTVSITKL